MRNRILTVLVAVVVGVVLLYGVPRAYSLSAHVQATERESTQHAADLAAVAVEERQRSGADVDSALLERLAQDQESIVYVAADGTRLRAGLPVEADGEDDLVAARSLADGGELTLRRSADLVDQRIADELMPLFLLGAALVVLACLLTWVLAERLSRPFRELAAVAENIGRGRFDNHIPPYRVAEAEAIADAMRRGSERWLELMRRERDVAANASHELRTPISALRTEIEDLASWPQTPPDVAAELRSYLPQLDRLHTAVRAYLDAVQAQRLTDVDVVDLAQVVEAAVQRWGPDGKATRTGPAVVLEAHEGVPMLVRGASATVAEILDHLFQDAVDRGAQEVRVELECTDAYGRVRLSLVGEVAPAGERAREAAAQTALAVDGRVSVVDGHSTLLLPRAV